MTPPVSPPAPSLWDARELDTLLPLSDLGGDCYANLWADANWNGRTYGGQPMAQALLAASHTVPPDRRACSLQATFLRGARVDQPMILQVERLLDGSRFSGRHVRILQGGHAVLDAQVMFQAQSQAPEQRCIQAPVVPGPDQLTDINSLLKHADIAVDERCIPLIENHCVEMRPVAPENFLFSPSEQPRLQFWLKLREPLSDSPALHDAALVYLSDFLTNFCSYAPFTPMVRMRAFYVASLCHGLWMHENGRVDNWLLFDTESPGAGHGRGLGTMQIYNHERRLIATATQMCTLGKRL